MSLFSSRRHGAVVGSSSKFISKVGRAPIEGLESRLLFAVNAWKSAVSGSWEDATKWTLGHIPTDVEDVQITTAGSYVVTLPATGDYRYVKSIKVGGGTGTQTLALNRVLYIKGSFSVAAGDVVNVEAGGNFYAYGQTGSTGVIDGTINLKATASKSSTLNVYSYPLTGTGKILGVNSGAYLYNYVYLGNGTLNSGLTLSGKNLNVYDVVNKGAIKIDGASTDATYLSRINNQGTISSTGAARFEIAYLNNAAGKTITVDGSAFRVSGTTYSNLGVINVSNTKIEYNQTFTSLGTVNRTNVSAILLSGTYDANGGNFNFSSATGQWEWYGGLLLNGNYDPTAPFAPKINLANGRGYGQLYKINLTGNLVIPAGFYFNSQQGLTIAAGKSITLNGSSTAGAGLYVYGSTLGGFGDVIFAGTGDRNTLSGNGLTIGSGITVRGKSGSLGGGLINNGTILADVAGGLITIADVINQGNIIAAPGKFLVYRYTGKSTGALTIGIGGTSAGSSYGQFNFKDTTFIPTLAGTFNTVLLNGYAPASGTSFTAATFVKPPTGTFSTTRLDAGNGKAFDLTLSTTSIVVKAKSSTQTFATRDGAGKLTVNGTSAADTITVADLVGVAAVTVAGKTSVFLDRALTSLNVNAQAGNDNLTITGYRGVSVSGSTGNDTLVGGSGNDSLDGGADNDSLVGSGGNDVLTGGDGSDTAVGGNGDDTYVFADATVLQTDTVTELTGGGTDTLSFTALGTTTAVTINLGSDGNLAKHTNRTVKTGAAGQYAFFENAVGGSGNDTLTGNSVANTLIGNAGNDSIVGSSGDDSIDGGSGNDTVSGGLGNDKLVGGSGVDLIKGDDGIDTLFGNDGVAGDTLDGGLGTDSLGGKDATDTVISIP